MFKNQTERESCLRAYFEVGRTSYWPAGIVSAGLGSVLLLSGLIISTSLGDSEWSLGCAGVFGVPGAILVLIGFARFVVARVVRARLASRSRGLVDRDVQALLDHDVAAIEEYALSTLGLSVGELPRRPITLVSPILWPVEAIDDEFGLSRSDGEGVVRSGVYSVAVLANAEARLGIFRGTLNFINGQLVESDSIEFLFQDIRSIQTGEGTRVVALASGQRISKVRELRIAVSNGDEIRVVVDIPELWKISNADAETEDRAELLVRELRARVRDRLIVPDSPGEF